MSERRSIIWITLDSIRADHTTLSGYDRDTTPRLEQIAAGSDGNAFSKAFAAGHATLFSSASILTGTYPLRHGLDSNNTTLSDALRTVPELLGERGYRTACISRNMYVSPGTGLDRGFDRFVWLDSSTLVKETPPSILIKYLLNLRRHSAGFTTDTSKHATPYLINEIATRWLKEFKRQRDPFFLYLHYNEPHRPYYPPLPYLDRYTTDLSMTPEEAAEISMSVHRNLNEIIAAGYTLSPREERALVAMYDAEIAYTDEMIGRFVDSLDALGLEDTTLVITADHGELFGEYGLLSHKGVLHDAVVHVPLVIRNLDGVDYQTDSLVQHTDVARTLVERADGNTDQFQGVDLRDETREYAISQRPSNGLSAFTASPEFDTSRVHTGALTMFRSDEFKYQWSKDKEQLFALPDEETDVRAQYPDVAASMSESLLTWLETECQPIVNRNETEDRMTDAMRRQLHDLGYLE